MDEIHTIYALVDPGTGKVRYIGMSKNPIKRYGQHLAKGAQWIKDMLQSGVIPTQIIIESELSLEQAKVREKFWIQHYEKPDNPLENMTHNNEATQARWEERHFTETLCKRFAHLPKDEMWQMVKITKWAYAAFGHCNWDTTFDVALDTIRILEKSPGLPFRMSDPEIAKMVLREFFNSEWVEDESDE
jgi:hypothetical protein